MQEGTEFHILDNLRRYRKEKNIGQVSERVVLSRSNKGRNIRVHIGDPGYQLISNLACITEEYDKRCPYKLFVLLTNQELVIQFSSQGICLRCLI